MAFQEDVIVDDVEDDSPEEVMPFEYSITSYGADFTIDGLVSRLRRGDIFIPSFQRAFVWDTKTASKFVESLLVGLPVPGIFLSREEDTKKLIIVDGQQRLVSLRAFYDGKFADTGKTFALTGLGEKSRFSGKTYESLEPEDRRTLDDAILHATIIRQDKPSDDNSSIYQVFERLNTGGLQLQPQEIRAAMYHGAFNDLLQDLNCNHTWRKLYGNVSNRMKDQELILRFLAMYFDRKNYQSPLKQFLNKYMGSNRNLTRQSEGEIRSVFENTMETIHNHLGPNAFKPSKGRFTVAVFDSVAVGIADRLKRGDILNGKELKAAYDALMENEDYRQTSIEGTAQTRTVNQRLTLAIKAFSDVP